MQDVDTKTMQILKKLHQKLIATDSPSYERSLYSSLDMSQRLIGLVGPRGVGKTTFLLEFLRRQLEQNKQDPDQVLYIAADHLYFADHNLLDVVDQFEARYEGQVLCVDEIHRYSNWNQELKNIYDFYPQLQVVFSGSSSIDLIKGKYDLSRRAFLRTFPGFSFREFLEIEIEQEFPVLELKQLLQPSTADKKILNQIGQTPKILGWFKQYLQQGYYPTYLEIGSKSDYVQSLISIMTKTIYQDVADFYSLKTSSLRELRKIMYFLATIKPGKINPNKIAGSIGASHQTVVKYIEILEETSLLRFLLIDKLGHALVRNARKVYLDNFNLLWAINNQLGHEPGQGLVRETFALNQLQNAGHAVSYPAHDQGDFMVEDWVLEIGGKNKDKSQIDQDQKAKWFLDDTLYLMNDKIPLYLLGFLY
jgi:hypothetical protein